MIASLRNRTSFVLGLLLLLTIPSFWRMLRPGIFSMHDSHDIRFFEFDKCIRDLQIPCRWAPDAAFGYGQPLFNFYSQMVFAIGEPFHLLGLQIIDTIKLLFILSLVLSAVAMFFLTRQLWGSSLAGLLSGVLYIYAPYRAVDVFVRGALPEAFAFVFFPLIIFFFNRYVLDERKKDLLLFSLSWTALLLIHNLSFLMFGVFLGVWGIYFLTVSRKWFLVRDFILGGILALSLSAYYLLPVVFERGLVTITKITEGYYYFQNHFTTLDQLLISRVWGYGASQWGPVDDLSFSIGHVHWILSLFLVGYLIVAKKVRGGLMLFVLVAIGWFALFLTHGKSLLIWKLVPGLLFLQFPWRFLSIAVFSFALAGGGLVFFVKNARLRILGTVFLVAVLLLLNVSFFREDIWYSTTDSREFSGEKWRWQLSRAVNDYWPKYAQKVPVDMVSDMPVFVEGEGRVVEFDKRSNVVRAAVVVDSEEAYLRFPVVYFPGWKGSVGEDGVPLDIYPSGDYGQITVEALNGERRITLKFEDTPVRTVGNLVTLGSLGLVVWFGVRERRRRV